VAWDDAPLRAVLAAAPAPLDPQAAYRERLAYFTVHRDACNRQRYVWANLSVVTFLGQITGGEYSGDSATLVATSPNLNLLDCLSPTGVTNTAGIVTLEIATL